MVVRQDFSAVDNFMRVFLEFTRIKCVCKGWEQQMPATDHFPEREMNPSIAENESSIGDGFRRAGILDIIAEFTPRGVNGDNKYVVRFTTETNLKF